MQTLHLYGRIILFIWRLFQYFANILQRYIFRIHFERIITFVLFIGENVKSEIIFYVASSANPYWSVLGILFILLYNIINFKYRKKTVQKLRCFSDIFTRNFKPFSMNLNVYSYQRIDTCWHRYAQNSISGKCSKQFRVLLFFRPSTKYINY